MLKVDDSIDIPSTISHHLLIGTGWECNTARELELDTCCLFYRYNKYIETVWALNKSSKDGACRYLGFPHWSQERDLQQISLNLTHVSYKISTIIICINIFSKNCSFGKSIKNSYLRLLDLREKEYCRFPIEAEPNDPSTSRVMVKLTRFGITQWKLTTIGKGFKGRTYKQVMPQISDLLDISPPTRSFYILINKAKGLAENKKGPTNVYAVVFYDTVKTRTQSIRSTEPKWHFNKKLTGTSRSLEIKVYWKNSSRTFGLSKKKKDTLIARLVIELDEETSFMKQTWFKFDKGHGRILLSVEEA